jgi:8-oxo-dGTP pyrophosphatase MutT (NUDIX family)
MMIAVLRPSSRDLLVRQYRPPLDRYTLEFPAGLIDPAEPPETTAVRELREETGYHGTVRWLGPACYNSPGMTPEFTHIARMDADENAPANRAPQTAFDEGEDIEILLCAQEEVPALLRRQQAAGTALDSKLVAYFLGTGALGRLHE